MKNAKVVYRKISHKMYKLQDVILALIRVWMAKVFFLSGLTKISHWDSTLLLFEYEYAVPFLSVTFAALSATFFELVMPVFIALGLLTRLAALPLLVITAVIEFTYGSFSEHIYWALMLGLLITGGAGRFALDRRFKLEGIND
ncbi:MAG: hypothetical protein CMK36_02430 [Porticoccaceae bacterium]|nr:hypothetical protein [Porticoccaceae bacterium]